MSDTYTSLIAAARSAEVAMTEAADILTAAADLAERRAKEMATGQERADKFAETLHRLADAIAVDIERDPAPAVDLVRWAAGDDDRMSALVTIAANLAEQAGFGPDELRDWATIAAPHRPHGWRP